VRDSLVLVTQPGPGSPEQARGRLACMSTSEREANMLRIYDVVLEVLKQLQQMLRRIEVRDRDLARQLRRCSSRLTLVRCHFPPLAVGTCRRFSSSARSRCETISAALSRRMVGATVRACRSAARLLASAPLRLRLRGGAFVGPFPIGTEYWTCVV